MIAGAAGLAALGALAIAARLPREAALPSVEPGRAEGSVVRESRALMGSMADVSVFAIAGREPAAAEAIRDALDLFAAIEKRVSAWEEASETSAVNRAAGGDFVRVSEEMRDLVAASIEWSKRTAGAFDVTGGPLFELWDAARKSGELPSPDDVRARLALVGFSRIELVGDLLRLETPGMKLGFGAIGEGFAADRAAALLRERGFRDFIVDASGDLVVSGSRGGEPWDSAIRHPRRDEFVARTRATDCAIATSGDYERCLVLGGERYSHILDLRTGWPARGAASVTVFARTATDADALATALAAMGVERGLEVVARRPGVGAFFVTEGGVTRCSAGLSFDGERLSWTR